MPYQWRRRANHEAARVLWWFLTFRLADCHARGLFAQTEPYNRLLIVTHICAMDECGRVAIIE